MAFTATIKNIVRENIGIRVMTSFSDGQDRNYVFDNNVSKADIRQAIRADLKILDDAEEKAVALEALIGEVIE